VIGPFKPAATHAGPVSHALSFAAAGLALLVSAPVRADFFDFLEFRGFRVEASYMADDNVPRAPSSDALRDWTLGVRISTSAVIPLTTRTRAAVQAFVGTQRYNTYTGLTNNFLGVQGDYFFRTSGEFGASTYGAFVRTAKEAYESNLRDGYRSAFGVTWLKPATDRIQLSAGLTRNISDGKSTVFDARNTALRGNADWSPGRWDTVYVGAEYRSGDSISTVSRSDPVRTLGFVNTATPNIVQDDAFTDTIRDAYRLKARALIGTLGYNHAFGGGQSLDVSWRRAQVAAQDAVAPASGSDLNYSVNQYSLAYLVRF
jgi:hypothetical protein